MKELLKRIPILGAIARRVWHALTHTDDSFHSSEEYWKQRYRTGGNSGPGSYNRLARFKAEVINGFVQSNKVQTIIEYGSGDGNQLKLADYPSYLGFDVSENAIKICRKKFKRDEHKIFRLMEQYQGEDAQLTLSLDVIYHLTEDEVYYAYMRRLFQSAQRFVIIYSSDYEEEQYCHQRHRKFTVWVAENEPHWELVRRIPNKYPWNGENKNTSLASFYIYEKS